LIPSFTQNKQTKKMEIKLSIWVTSLALVACSVAASHAGVRVWNGSASSDWADMYNWSQGVPGIEDTAYINGAAANAPVIDAAVPPLDFLSVAYPEGLPASLTVEDGGRLELTGEKGTVVVGTAADATLEVAGGEVTAHGEIIVGYGSSTGTLSIAGGSVTADRWRIPSTNSGHDAAVGIVEITGGTMFAGREGDEYGADPSLRLALGGLGRTGAIDVGGSGRLALFGDWETPGTAHANHLVNAIGNGWITANGQSGADNFTVQFDSDTGYTFLSPARPETP
jgi:hypothetical protein